MKENSNSQSLLLTCLARQIIRDYPSQGRPNYKVHDYGTTELLSRDEFYRRWEKRHGIVSLETLRKLVSLEIRNFKGWCALEGIIASHSNFPRYLATNPARLLSETEIKAVPLDIPAVPWWSDVPWLAPKGQGVRHV